MEDSKSNSTASPIFQAITNYEKHIVKTVKIGDMIWFKAKDIADILEYRNTNQAIQDNVSDVNKANLRSIIEPVAHKLSQNDLKDSTKISSLDGSKTRLEST